MGLIEQLTGFFRRQDTTPAKTTSTERMPRGPRPMEFAERFRVETDRRSMVTLAREMYEMDPRVDRAIVDLARDATKGGFQVAIQDGPLADRAQAVAEETIKRLKLERRIDDWFRLALRDGDAFLELGVDEDRQIVEITRKPTLEIHRYTDRFDRWIDPVKAFWWAEDDWGWALEPGPEAIWLPAWMMVHARWRWDGDTRYGRPLFGPAARAYKRVAEGESDIAIRRKTRAGMRYVHELPDADDARVQEYMQINAEALGSTAAVVDFFTNVQGGISAIQGDANLSQIEDVEHHIETMFLASPLPLALVGYGKNLNRDILEQKQDQYDRALEGISAWVVDQMVEPILERQWLLAGIWPEGLEYEIRQAYKKPLTADEVRQTAEALIKLKATQLFQDEMLIDIGAMMLPHVDAERVKEELQAAMEAQPDEIERMAALVQAQQAQNQQGPQNQPPAQNEQPGPGQGQEEQGNG